LNHIENLIKIQPYSKMKIGHRISVNGVDPPETPPLRREFERGTMKFIFHEPKGVRGNGRSPCGGIIKGGRVEKSKI
jgi:hypothetical protein